MALADTRIWKEPYAHKINELFEIKKIIENRNNNKEIKIDETIEVIEPLKMDKKENRENRENNTNNVVLNIEKESKMRRRKMQFGF